MKKMIMIISWAILPSHSLRALRINRGPQIYKVLYCLIFLFTQFEGSPSFRVSGSFHHFCFFNIEFQPRWVALFYPFQCHSHIPFSPTHHVQVIRVTEQLHRFLKIVPLRISRPAIWTTFCNTILTSKGAIGSLRTFSGSLRTFSGSLRTFSGPLRTEKGHLSICLYSALGSLHCHPCQSY